MTPNSDHAGGLLIPATDPDPIAVWVPKGTGLTVRYITPNTDHAGGLLIPANDPEPITFWGSKRYSR